MNNPIHKAFEPVHASDGTLEEVLQMIETKHNRPYPLVRTLLAAAAAFVLLAFGVFAADYVINQRQIFFFDTLEALTHRQTQDNPNAAVSCPVPGSAEENQDLETSVQYVARAMVDGLLDNEKVIEEGSSPSPAGGQERWVIREGESPLHGQVITQYRTSPAYARELSVDGVLRWDLSGLDGTLTPDEGGQILVVSKSKENQELLWVKAHLGYTTADGSRFSLSYTYDTAWDYGEIPEYVLNDAYDSSEVFVTQDQVQVLLLSYDGQVWAKAAGGLRSVDIYTTGCTVEETKEILNRLELAQVLG